jgi:hypothetical protein
MDLRSIPVSERTNTIREQIEYFDLRGSSFLLVSAIAASIETMLNKPIPDTFNLHWKNIISLHQAIDNWSPVIVCLLPFTNNLGKAITETRLQNKENVENSIKTFRSFVEATKAVHGTIFTQLAEKIDIT